MKYGFIIMPRMLAAPGRLDQFQSELDVLAEAGYDGVELNLTEPFGIELDTLEKWTRARGLGIPSLLTGEAYFDGLCLSSPQAEIRRQTVERLIRYTVVAQRLGALLVVGLLQGLRRDEPDPAIAAERIADCLKSVGDAAAERGVPIVIEPVNHLQVGFHHTVAEVRALIDRIGSPAFRPMVDTIHMNVEEASLTQPVLDCGSTLGHVHLCESNGGEFGTGRVDFASVLGALRAVSYSRYASVKVYRKLSFDDAARSSIRYLRALEAAAAG